MKYILGIEVTYSKVGIFLSLRKYVLDLLAETSLIGGKGAGTPVDPNTKLNENPIEELVDKGRFQWLLGRLIYLSHTRPDIAFDVSLVSQFMFSPTKEHMHAMRRILNYLKATPGKAILFALGTDLTIHKCTNVDYGGSLVDRRPITVYCVFLGGNLVSWRNKK